jgi:hypothetical protein
VREASPRASRWRHGDAQTGAERRGGSERLVPVRSIRRAKWLNVCVADAEAHTTGIPEGFNANACAEDGGSRGGGDTSVDDCRGRTDVAPGFGGTGRESEPGDEEKRATECLHNGKPLCSAECRAQLQAALLKARASSAAVPEVCDRSDLRARNANSRAEVRLSPLLAPPRHCTLGCAQTTGNRPQSTMSSTGRDRAARPSRTRPPAHRR